MKILFVTNEVPYPPDNGIRIVSYHAMRLMHEAGHQIALAVLTDEEDDVENRFSRICRDFAIGPTTIHRLKARSRLQVMANSLVRGTPYFIERYRDRDFEEDLLSIIEDFDPEAIHFDSICMSQYVNTAPPGKGTVASINDSYAFTLQNSISAKIYEKSESLYRRLQFIQTKYYEKNIYPRHCTTHVMSDHDSSFLKKINPEIHTTVIPNGVDPAIFNENSGNTDSNDVVFVAKLVGENLDNLKSFLDKSWPTVVATHPASKIRIVGKIGNEAAHFKKAYESENVIFDGYVEDISSAYRRCGIAIVPINKNCGIINKAIEAMAAGLAVVGFKKSFSGIPEAIEDTHYLAAEDHAGLGIKVASLMGNQPLKISLQLAARKMAMENYSWESRKHEYEKMYAQAAKQAMSINNTTSTIESTPAGTP